MSQAGRGSSRQVAVRAGSALLSLVALLVSLLAIGCSPPTHPAPVDPSRFSVAAYGDSLTAGWGTSPGGWPADLPTGWTVFNAGIDGEMGVPKRNNDGNIENTGADRPISPPDFAALTSGWHVVVMMWGTNDVVYPAYSDGLGPLLPDGWPPADVLTDESLMDSIDRAATTLQGAGIRVVVAWPPPRLPSDQSASVANTRLDRMRGPMQSRLGAHGVGFVDLFAAFSASDAMPDPSIYYQDTVHWNPLGSAMAASAIAQAILAGCPTGFTGTGCTTVVDACASSPCMNGGACSDGAASYTCTCPSGFTGVDCETTVDYCASSPCVNGGTCSSGAGSYTCTCPMGFTGVDCETTVDYCASSPCVNGGTCSNDAGGYTCSCPTGYTGADCETAVDYCASSPCVNGGTCSNDAGGYTCSCPTGYTGVDCETSVDYCASTPCMNGGVCSNETGGYSCACPTGYTGVSCETLVDNCASSPCVNGGTCSNGVGSYTCTCPAGFTGVDCETAVDYCASGPCVNGGVCSNEAGGYSCDCPAGFSGTDCENADE